MLAEGDLVLKELRAPIFNPKGKFKPNWVGPYITRFSSPDELLISWTYMRLSSDIQLTTISSRNAMLKTSSFQHLQSPGTMLNLIPARGYVGNRLNLVIHPKAHQNTLFSFLPELNYFGLDVHSGISRRAPRPLLKIKPQPLHHLQARGKLAFVRHLYSYDTRGKLPFADKIPKTPLLRFMDVKISNQVRDILRVCSIENIKF